MNFQLRLLPHCFYSYLSLIGDSKDFSLHTQMLVQKKEDFNKQNQANFYKFHFSSFK